MRLTYKKKSKTVKEKTLEQIRFLRMKLEEEHPDLMEKLKRDIMAQPIYDDLTKLPSPNEPKEKLTLNDDGDVIVDQKKNLHTIMIFAKNHKGTQSFDVRFKKLLMETLQEKS